MTDGKVMQELLDKMIDDGVGCAAAGVANDEGWASLQVNLVTGPIAGAVRKGAVAGSYVCNAVGAKLDARGQPTADPTTGRPVAQIVDIHFAAGSVVAITVEHPKEEESRIIS